MKVFPMMIKEQTFSLSELVTVVELLRDQLVLTHAHAEAGTDLPNQLEEALATQISQAGLSISSSNSPGDYPEGDKTQSVSETSSLSSVTTAANTAPPSITITAAAGAAPHGSTSASVHWYVVTFGCETGVFQGWHNVHSHVVGVPGACFGQYSSRAVADEAYAQELQDGTVHELPL
ncbi:uncharacterized protein EDB91DRAFT_1249427 [Suillus paluster]|uniref:uncharacterized protein n=1 Tax=Suillus paluster TaxID=48578 RepID=UPI001B881834|nr:uncharacterized protein EDB91DRAFT_1249427 [Suillus paluster]KAG1738113.1 hypothetical protein EDB91DRAFT_1249427 [Suillus paluster]